MKRRVLRLLDRLGLVGPAFRLYEHVVALPGAEEQAEQLRQDLSRRDDQLKELRKDWEDVTQRVSQVLLELLEKRHDEH